MDKVINYIDLVSIVICFLIGIYKMCEVRSYEKAQEYDKANNSLLWALICFTLTVIVMSVI